METETEMMKKRRRKRGIARDGERITVPMVLMDGQQQDAAATALDAERADADARQLAAAKAHANAVQAWADRFDGLRDGAEAERQRTEPAQAAYEEHIGNAWQNPPNIPTGA